MKFKELTTASVKELELKLRENRAEQLELKKKKSAGTLEKPHTLKILRKDAARILTAVNQKKASDKPEPKAPKAPVAAPKAEKAGKTVVAKEVKKEKKVSKKESAK
jgi:large subunit ribosomal protein L29